MYAALKIWKYNGTIALHFRQRKELNHRLGDNAQIALRTKHPQAWIDAGRFARSGGETLHDAVGANDIHIDDYIFYIAVTILFHPAGMGGDPAAERAELHRIRFVAHCIAVASQLCDDVPTNGARLDAGHPVGRIDPQDLIHPAHVDRTDHPFFVGRAAQRLGDIGAAAVGNQTDIVFLRRLDQLDDLGLFRRVDNQIGNPRQAAILDQKHLFLGMAVPVTLAGPIVGADLRFIQKLADCTAKAAILPGWRNAIAITTGPQVVGIDLQAKYVLDPGQQFGQFAPGKRIAFAKQLNVTALIDHETSVAKTPDIKALAVVGVDRVGRRCETLLAQVGIGQLREGRDLCAIPGGAIAHAIAEPLHDAGAGHGSRRHPRTFSPALQALQSVLDHWDSSSSLASARTASSRRLDITA